MSSYTLLEKRKRRGQVLSEMEAIAQRGKDADGQEQLKFAELKTELDIIDADLRSLTTELAKRDQEYKDSYVKEKGRSLIGQVFRYMADPGAPNIAPEVRALNSTGASATIQDPNISNEIIYTLSAGNVLAGLGARFLNLENNTQWPAVTANPTAYWQSSEGSEITVDSALTITGRKIEYKDLAVRVRVSNQVLRDASGRAEELIEGAAMRALDDAINTAIFHGTGASGQPLGFIVPATESVLSGVLEIDNAGAAYDFGTIITAYKTLMDNNVPLDRIGMVTNPSAWAYLNTIQDQNLQYVIPPMDLDKSRWRYTSSISTAMDSSTTTCAILGQWDQLVVGFQPTFEIVADQPRAGFLETEFIFWARVDIEVLNPTAFLVLHSLPLT